MYDQDWKEHLVSNNGRAGSTEQRERRLTARTLQNYAGRMLRLQMRPVGRTELIEKIGMVDTKGNFYMGKGCEAPEFWESPYDVPYEVRYEILN